MPQKELRSYLSVIQRTRCRKRLRVASRKWNRPSVPTVGLIDTSLEIANRSADILWSGENRARKVYVLKSIVKSVCFCFLNTSVIA